MGIAQESDKDSVEPGVEPLSGGGVLAFVVRDHEAQSSICDMLEEIADSLPGHIDQNKCVCAAMALTHRVKVHHHVEEAILFPRIIARAPGDCVLHSVFSRLEGEHRTDEGHCDEAIELLTQISSGTIPPNVEAAGYLLRGLFEGLRRHIAFENDYVIPKAAELLTEADLAAIASEINGSVDMKSSACFADTRKTLKRNRF